MKPKNPSARFEENEADRLIASYGQKPAPEKKQALMASLQNQKEQFKANERRRDAKTKERDDHSM